MHSPLTVAQGRHNALIALITGLQLLTHSPLVIKGGQNDLKILCVLSGKSPSGVPVGCIALPADKSIHPGIESNK